MSENILSIIREELGLLILENRIDKLRREKYPEDIINFAYEFAKLTTRDPSQEENLLRNQYIPWIAQEAKKNPAIINDKSKFDVLVNWIKQANYPPINSRDNFDAVIDKAQSWLSKKNINPTSGERIEGGRVAKTYPNGFRWIRVTNTNWCMNVGDQYGWCFNDPKRAETFVGLGEIGTATQGYILLSDKDKPILAVQYDKQRGIINDIQAPFNKPAEPKVIRYGFDLFGSLGGITNIEGHLDNFWQTLKEHPELKQELLKIDGVNLSLDVKLNRQFPLTPEERSKLNIIDLLKHGIALTPEEIISVPIELKLKYNIPLSNQETKLLKSSKNLFIAKLWRSTKSRSYEKIFTAEDFAGYKAYEFDYNKRAVKLDIDENEFEEKFSGMDSGNLQYYNTVNAGDYNENVDSSEDDYMNNYLNDKNEKLIKNIASQLGIPDYDFEKEGNLAKFLEEYTDIKIEDDFRYEVGNGWERHAAKAINDEVNNKQKFKYIDGYLILPFKELYKFVSEHPEKYIKSFNDLKESEINGEIDLERVYSDSSHQIDDEAEKKINLLFKEKLTEFLDKIHSGEIDTTKIQRAKEILKTLGFKKLENMYFHGHNFPGFVYAVRKGGRAVFVISMDFEQQKFNVKVMDFGKSIRKDATPQKVLQGKIPFERLADYVYQHELFEGMKLREFIRDIIAEDFRYMYDKKTFTPPADVIKTAKIAIGASQQNRLSDNSGSSEGSGMQKAQSIVAGTPMNHAQLKRMKAFFDNNQAAVKNELTQGKNVYNSGLIQSWNLWGGDAGKRWAESNISSVQSSNKTSKKVRNPEDGLRTKTLMDPHNTRIHREAYINASGELIGLSSNGEDDVAAMKGDDIDFINLFTKYDATGKYVGGNGFEYWFPPEAEEELNAIGIDWYEKQRISNPQHQDYNKLFLVFAYTPRKVK